MDAVLEILKIILPATAVFVAVYFVVKSFLSNEQKRREFELRKEMQNTILPLKIQAHERLVIFLERIHPSSLIVRVNKKNMSVYMLQMELIRAIKTEYEHNISQQIHVSSGAWQMVKNAKEELLKIVNVSATKLSPDAPSNELAMAVLNVAAGLDKKFPSEMALEYIKKEIARHF
jgi:hypothetical protein